MLDMGGNWNVDPGRYGNALPPGWGASGRAAAPPDPYAQQLERHNALVRQQNQDYYQNQQMAANTGLTNAQAAGVQQGTGTKGKLSDMLLGQGGIGDLLKKLIAQMSGGGGGAPPGTFGQFTPGQYATGTAGGYTRAPMFIAGDSPRSAMRAGGPEMIENPTGAPIRVHSNPATMQMLRGPNGVYQHFGCGTGGGMPRYAQGTGGWGQPSYTGGYGQNMQRQSQNFVPGVAKPPQPAWGGGGAAPGQFNTGPNTTRMDAPNPLANNYGNPVTSGGNQSQLGRGWGAQPQGGMQAGGYGVASMPGVNQNSVGAQNLFLGIGGSGVGQQARPSGQAQVYGGPGAATGQFDTTRNDFRAETPFAQQQPRWNNAAAPAVSPLDLFLGIGGNTGPAYNPVYGGQGARPGEFDTTRNDFRMEGPAGNPLYDPRKTNPGPYRIV